MENMVIISYYDSGVYSQIMVKGKNLTRHCDEYNDIIHAYSDLGTGDFLDYMFRKYECDILVCDNGEILYYPYNGYVLRGK